MNIAIRIRFFLYISLTTVLACGPPTPLPTCELSPTSDNYGQANDYGFVAYTDLGQAQQCAQQTGRPILIMFTGWACHSTPDLPWKILQEAEVTALIREHYILVTLYVDDKTPLAHIDTTQKTHTGKTMQTIGDQNLTFQIEGYQSNAQPLYAIVDQNLADLTTPIGYVPLADKQQFVDFLENGIHD